MNRRVLITGSTGYIGKHIAERLLPLEDVDVYGFNRTYDARLEARFSLEGSILDADLSTWLVQARPDVIFHCIGTSQRAPFDHQLLVNAEGTRRLLQALVDGGLRPRVVIVGSAAEYGLRDEPVDEQAVCVPEGEYGIAKLAQTQVAQSFARRYDLPVVIGRVFNVYGITERHLAVASMASQIAQIEAMVPLPSELHVYNLRSKRDFLHINDAVDALLALADKLGRTEASGQIYNIASGESTAISTVLDLLLTYSRLSREDLKSIELRIHGMQREDVSWANIDKIRQHTGWSPAISIEDGLKREMEYWHANLGETVPVAGGKQRLSSGRQ
jgi:nucleoside-diphosphate-sugar epimerase